MLRKNRILLFRYILILFVVSIILIPIYAAIIGSLTPYQNLNSQEIFPSDLRWQNYVDVWKSVPLLDHLLASLIYSISVSSIGVILATFAAYSVSRYKFTGRGIFIYLLL